MVQRRTYDAAVVGLGGMGSSAAYHLARRGARVLGLEQFGPAHDQGSSHGRSRIIRTAYFEGGAYVPLLQRAFELWRQLQAESAQHLLTMTGGIYIGAPGSELLEGSRTSARAHGLSHEMLDSAAIRQRFPQFSPAEQFVGLYEQQAGVIDPERSVQAALDTATRQGADLRFDERVLTVEPASSGEGVLIETNQGRYTVGRLVLAAGPWTDRLLPDLRLPLTVLRTIMFWFQPTSRPEAFLPESCPVYIWEGEDGLQFYGFPALDGIDGGVKVALHTDNRTPTTPETIDRTVHEDETGRMRAALARYMPLLGGKCVDARTCMYTMTPDEHFILDLHPLHRQVAIAAGFSGHGFKFCSVVGEVMADLALQGKTHHNIDLFRLDRSAMRAGAEATRKGAPGK